MLDPSCSLAPVAPVEAALSEPARSTRLISDTFSFKGIPFSLSKNLYLNVIVVTVWALLLVAFMLVDPIVLLLVPISIYCYIS